MIPTSPTCSTALWYCNRQTFVPPEHPIPCTTLTFQVSLLQARFQECLAPFTCPSWKFWLLRHPPAFWSTSLRRVFPCLNCLPYLDFRFLRAPGQTSVCGTHMISWLLKSVLCSATGTCKYSLKPPPVPCVTVSAYILLQYPNYWKFFIYAPCYSIAYSGAELMPLELIAYLSVVPLPTGWYLHSLVPTVLWTLF